MERIVWACLLGAVVCAVGCVANGQTSSSDPEADAGPIPEPDAEAPEEEPGPRDPERSAGAVFTLSNDPEGNAVVMLARRADGALTPMGEFATGGLGTGMGLGSQGALAVDEERDLLYVVNPGSGSVSSMRIYDDHVALVDTIHTGGEMPTSLAAHGATLYVLEAGGGGGVVGLSVDGDGRMTRIEGATRALSGTETAPAQIGVTPAGDWLVVTERATDSIVTYAIEEDGALGEPVVNASTGRTPFGFAFTSGGILVVSEAFGGDAGASAVSSYRVSDGGVLWPFSDSIPNGETAACWTAIVHDRFAYTTNTGSNTLSGYHIEDDGQVRLFDAGGETAQLGEDRAPIDMATSDDGAYLYVLNRDADTIATLAVADDGTLEPVGTPVAVPEASWGLTGY